MRVSAVGIARPDPRRPHSALSPHSVNLGGGLHCLLTPSPPTRIACDYPGASLRLEHRAFRLIHVESYRPHGFPCACIARRAVADWMQPCPSVRPKHRGLQLDIDSALPQRMTQAGLCAFRATECCVVLVLPFPQQGGCGKEGRVSRSRLRLTPRTTSQRFLDTVQACDSRRLPKPLVSARASPRSLSRTRGLAPTIVSRPAKWA